MEPRRRVVVTGLGVVSALGLEEHSVWNNMLAGRSGISRLTGLDVAELKSKNASQIDSVLLQQALGARGITPSDRTIDIALLASAEALEQAGLVKGSPPYAPIQVGTIFGTGHGPAHSIHSSWMDFAAKGPRGVRPTSIPRCMANAISAQISMRFRLTGPNYVVTCACTSATTAIGIAFRMIRDGYARQVLCGGAESALDPGSVAAWSRLGVMSKNDDPQRACRPFDRDRDGFVIGEGAAAILLESLESARERAARIRAEVCGYGESSDADHITRPSAEGQAQSICAALQDAGITPGDVGFINAHGTATKANDECESQSIRLALGAAADAIPVASNKSFFGHLLGAAGALETLVTILGLEYGTVPPNLNLENPDPACAVRLVGAQPLALNASYAMKNSFGFGGDNGVLVLRKWTVH